MKIYEVLFGWLRKIENVLQRKVGILSVSGIVFFSIIFIILAFIELSNLMGFPILTKITYVLFKILLLYIVMLIPLAENKVSKSLRTISHKSYLYFIGFTGVILWYLTSEIIKLFPSLDYEKVFINNQINIVFTIYGLLTIIWFAYQLVNTKLLSKLRKQIQFYIFIITIIQLFVVNKYSSFEYCISVLIITYTYIQYLFELKVLKLEESET